MTRTILITAALALAVTLPIAPAQATGTGVARTFLSAAGSDSNNCANFTHCRPTSFSINRLTEPGYDVATAAIALSTSRHACSVLDTGATQ